LAATITGTRGNDFLRGTNGADNIGARDGNDEVRALAGNDQVNGGTGNDQLYGKENADTIVGGRDNDRLDGGIGNDTLKSHFDGSADNLSCSQGKDTAHVDVNDFVDGNKAKDVIATVVQAADNVVTPVTTCETLKVYILNEDLVVTLRLGDILGDEDVTGGTLDDFLNILGIIDIDL
jgi:Ca2+-binding RTX toxin-like protein